MWGLNAEAQNPQMHIDFSLEVVAWMCTVEAGGKEAFYWSIHQFQSKQFFQNYFTVILQLFFVSKMLLLRLTF